MSSFVGVHVLRETTEIWINMPIIWTRKGIELAVSLLEFFNRYQDCAVL